MFYIITPTYKRSTDLTRAVESVLQQQSECKIIIINDSPDDISYSDFEQKYSSDTRIVYLKNPENKGVNFSRNRALDYIATLHIEKNDWAILLDDDDYLAPTALKDIEQLIAGHTKQDWFMTNRAYDNGATLTSAPQPDHIYKYAKDYLIGRKIKGDATHIMRAELLRNIRFSTYIKQGEEWFFFFQLGLKTPLFYSSLDSTLSHGYSVDTGLNFRKRTRKERLQSIKLLFKEGRIHRLHLRSMFLLYLFLRCIMLIKSK